MKVRLLASVFFATLSMVIFAQVPQLYIQFVTHNEPSDNLQTTLNYTKAKIYDLQFASLIDSRQAKWNLQTSDGLVLGALNDQTSTSTNIFKTLASAPYADNVEIDPRYKNMGGRNIADQWHLLDSLGANPTSNLGGCIYFTTNASLQPIDWEQYRNPIIGNIYHNSWQCSKLTGAGSYPPHTNDLNDFGIFKPDTASNFYQHNAAKNLWCVGTGCAPVLDSADDEQAIIRLIRNQVDSIQNGQWPSNKFYVTRIMTNQREFGPMLMQKVRNVLDSLKLIPSSKLQWATINETFAAFQLWQTSSGLDHSQWLCGEKYTGITGIDKSIQLHIYPNPSQQYFRLEFEDMLKHQVQVYDAFGRLMQESNTESINSLIDASLWSKGIYIVRIDNIQSEKIIKN